MLILQKKQGVTGPFTLDGNTVLLMNFNGDYDDEAGHTISAYDQNGVVPSLPTDMLSSTAAFGSHSGDLSEFGCDSFRVEPGNNPNMSDFIFGTGDFTLEGYFSVQTSGGTFGEALIDFRPFNNNGNYPILGVKNFKFNYGSNGVTHITTTSTVVANTWVHIALVRASSVIKIYYNGTEEASFSNSTNLNVGTIQLGRNAFAATAGSDSCFRGKMDSVHISNIARYTTNFTPVMP